MLYGVMETSLYDDSERPAAAASWTATTALYDTTTMAAIFPSMQTASIHPCAQ